MFYEYVWEKRDLGKSLEKKRISDIRDMDYVTHANWVVVGSPTAFLTVRGTLIMMGMCMNKK